MLLTPAEIKPKSFESRRNSFFTRGGCVSCLRACLGAKLLPQSYQYPNLSEGADRVGLLMQAVGVGFPGNAGTPGSRTPCGVAVSDSLWRCCFRHFVALLFQTPCGVAVSDTLWRCCFRLFLA